MLDILGVVEREWFCDDAHIRPTKMYANKISMIWLAPSIIMMFGISAVGLTYCYILCEEHL